MAKQLICDRLRLTLPAWNGTDGMPNPPTARDVRGEKMSGARVDFPAQTVQLRIAKPEVRIADYRPDVLAEDDDGELLIEIRVSHAVSSDKTRNVQSEGRRMIEIDLSDVRSHHAYDSSEFETLVLYTARNRSWISCPPATELWRAARDALAVRLATRNRNLAADQERQHELASLRPQGEHERAIWRHQKTAELRQPYAEDLHYLLQATTPKAITAKYALLLQKDEDRANALLTLIPEVLHSTLRSSSGPAWAYQSHYLLWQPAMYLQFIGGRPIGHPVKRATMGRWLRATYGVDATLWRLFMAQWTEHKKAQQRARTHGSMSLTYFTEEENRAVPNFFHCVTGFVNRLVAAGALDLDPEQKGDLIVSATPGSDIRPISRTPRAAPRHVDPLLETGEDRYINRRISHSKLGVGVIRQRAANGSPTYRIWFNGATWRTVWLGNPDSGEWRIIGD